MHFSECGRELLLCRWISNIFIRFALLTLRSPLVLMSPWVVLKHEIAFCLRRRPDHFKECYFRPLPTFLRQWKFERAIVVSIYFAARERGKKKIDLEMAWIYFHSFRYLPARLLSLFLKSCSSRSRSGCLRQRFAQSWREKKIWKEFDYFCKQLFHLFTTAFSWAPELTKCRHCIFVCRRGMCVVGLINCCCALCGSIGILWWSLSHLGRYQQ